MPTLPRSVAAALALFAFSAHAAAQCKAPDVADPAVTQWSNKILGALVGDQACYADKSALTNSDCNIFVGRVLEQGYGITDFVVASPQPSPQGDLRYRTASDVALLLWTTLSGKWEVLGGMQNQTALAAAQQHAFAGHAVIAVWRNPNPQGHGHVALIGPGPLTYSGMHKLNLPVSASFFQGKPQANYIGKPLACAFTPEQAPGVRLYVRK